MKHKRNIIIIGSGRVGIALAVDQTFANDNIILIDQDETLLKTMNANFGGITLHGDATNVETLIKAGIETADIVIAATNNDNINIFISLVSKEVFGIKNVIARLYDESRSFAYEKLNIETVCPSALSAIAIRDKISETKGANE